MTDDRLPDDPMVPLACGGLRLEPLTLAHADELFPLLADPALYRWMDQDPPPSLQHLQGVYARLQARGPGDGSGEVWFNWIVRGPHGRAAGVVQATLLPQEGPPPGAAPPDPVQPAEPRTAWVAYVLGKAHQGRGWARQATAAMVAHLVRDWGVRRCLAMVEAEHHRSLHLLQALGFVPASAALALQHGAGPSERLLVRELADPPPDQRPLS